MAEPNLILLWNREEIYTLYIEKKLLFRIYVFYSVLDLLYEDKKKIYHVSTNYSP